VNFRPKSLFISERYEIGPWLPWINYRKSYVADRSLSVPVALSDLERRDAGVKRQIILADQMLMDQDELNSLQKCYKVDFLLYHTKYLSWNFK